MKRIIKFKKIFTTVLSSVVIMFIFTSCNAEKNMISLTPDGEYSYPDFCIGHEEDFLVNANSQEYIKNGYVSDIEYIGDNGDFSYKSLSLEMSTYDENTSSFYNESLNFGFKLPDEWKVMSQTPTTNEKYTYIYDFGAVSPDGNYTVVVKYHDIGTDKIPVDKYSDYFDRKTDAYYEKGYTNITRSNIFAGDKYCSLAVCEDPKDTTRGKYYVASQILSTGYVMLIEYHTSIENRHKDVWENFYSVDINNSAFADVTYVPRSAFDSEKNYISNQYTNINFYLPEKWTIYADAENLGKLHNLSEDERIALDNEEWDKIESINYIPDYNIYGDKGGDKISVIYYPVSENTTAESCCKDYVAMFKSVNSDLKEHYSMHLRMHPMLPSNINSEENRFEKQSTDGQVFETSNLEFYTAVIKAAYWGKNAYEYGSFAQINDDYIIGVLFSTTKGTEPEQLWSILGFDG